MENVVTLIWLGWLISNGKSIRVGIDKIEEKR